jgi:tetratricopeptide (TPR) repeat protein
MAMFADTTKKYDRLLALDADFAKKDFNNELLQHRDIDIRLKPLFKFNLTEENKVLMALERRYEEKTMDQFIASVPVPIELKATKQHSDISTIGYEGEISRRVKELQNNTSLDSTAKGKAIGKYMFAQAIIEGEKNQYNSALSLYDKALWNEPEQTFKSYIGTDYWFRQGDALFLMLDSCNVSMKEHYNFMKNATEQNADATWIIAVMHHDMFGGRKPSRDSENNMLQLLWTPFFDEFGVDMCLYGHSHYYSVSNVIYGRKTVEETSHNAQLTNPEGTVYVSSGSISRQIGRASW